MFCFVSPVEFEGRAHRQQHKGHHSVTDGYLCAGPRDDIIHKLVCWRTQEVWPYIVSHLRNWGREGKKE